MPWAALLKALQSCNHPVTRGLSLVSRPIYLGDVINNYISIMLTYIIIIERGWLQSAIEIYFPDEYDRALNNLNRAHKRLIMEVERLRGMLD